MSSHAQAAVPSQPLYIMRRQRSASHTLHQALPKSTSPARTFITCRNQHTANSRAKEAETSHPVCGQDGLKQLTHYQDMHGKERRTNIKFKCLNTNC
ncbi:hypothetical protein FHG87_006049 [Trinorchestia longiramus]|nr:hypothetical protein FHG87_006049 [Trinorchestia longiramus]